MARVPLSGTNIHLISGVPFNSDYKHTRWFDSKSEQTSYFLGKQRAHTMNEANFQRIDGYSYVKVNKSIEDLWDVDYLMFQNSQYSNKWFYAFVTKLEYKQRNMTQVYFQLDVFQTWLFDITFQPSFVVREHCKLWEDDGSPVLNTVDEGLDYGSEYQNVAVENWKPYGDIFFLVVGAKQAMHTTGSKDYTDSITSGFSGVPTPINYYIHPFYFDGTAPEVRAQPSMTGWSLTPVLEFLNAMYTNTNAVNNIVSIYITDMVSGSIEIFDEGTAGEYLNITNGDIYPVQITGSKTADTLWMFEAPNFTPIQKNLGDKYSGYRPVKESKLLMHPYTSLVLDDFRGNRVDYKNEYIYNKDLVVYAKGSSGASNYTSYGISYNEGSELLYPDMLALTDESALINNNPNDVPIVSDYLSAFIQGHKNSVQTQQSSIMFNGMMDLIGSAVGGVASGLERNGVGVASASVNAVKGAGNTYYRIKAIESKMKDINNKPPQMAKMGSNSSYDYGNGYKGLYLIKKQIKYEYQRKLEDFFNMFGYKLNEVKIPNFHTRERWNFVQTESCLVTGDINNEDIKDFQNLFDQGITLWHTDNIGGYASENGVI